MHLLKGSERTWTNVTSAIQSSRAHWECSGDEEIDVCGEHIDGIKWSTCKLYTIVMQRKGRYYLTRTHGTWATADKIQMPGQRFPKTSYHHVRAFQVPAIVRTWFYILTFHFHDVILSIWPLLCLIYSVDLIWDQLYNLSDCLLRFQL